MTGASYTHARLCGGFGVVICIRFGKRILQPAAKADLLKVAKENSAVVERLLATEFEHWAAIPGKRYAEK